MADSNLDDLSPEMREHVLHTAGEGIVVTCVYADGGETTFVPDDECEAYALWQDEAFTNGPRLKEIRIRWAPDEAKKLSESAG